MEQTVRYAKNAAFSLVELSIVLVILGLLVGGVLGGRSLIKAAELRAVTTELQQWETAANAFRNKYNALPGDFNRATSFWGSAGTCPPPPGGAPLGNQTCNGTGNGYIGSATVPAERYEAMLFWHHLAAAGLVGGRFSGVPGSAGTADHIIDENAPRSKYPSAGWSIHTPIGSANQYDLDYKNSFIFGSQRVGNVATSGKALTPEDAWNIDMKIDDGRPASGGVTAIWLINECSAANSGSHTNTNYDARYRVEDTSIQCALIFRNRL